METLVSTCRYLVVLLFLSPACSQDVISHNVVLPSQDGVYFVREGSSFDVCCPRIGKFSGDREISVSISGGTTSSTDFEIETATISAEDNCTTILAVEDADCERNKVFEVTLRPIIVRDLESEDNVNQSSAVTSFTVILEDNDSPTVECSRSFVHTKNIMDIFQEWNSCAISADLFGQCDPSHSFLDCTRWNPELVSLLESSESNALFPNVDPEFRTVSRRSCIDLLKTRLASGFNAGPSSDEEKEECYTNCTATLSNECSISVFLLENVSSYRIANLSSANAEIPQQCGSFQVSCCTEFLPAKCLNPDPRASPGGSGSSLIPAIVGGVVGSVVVIGAIIVLTVVAGIVVVCVRQRKNKQQKQWKESPSSRVQSIVYKPKRMESAGARSNISQESTAASTVPLTREGSRSRTITRPNYEEVMYTESYVEWQKNFAKVMIDASYLDYGDLIGEGEFSKVYKAEYTKPGESTSMQVAVKNLKTASDSKEIEKFIAESAIMMDFDHPNILRLIGVCSNMEDNLPAIVLPYMAMGDLRSFLRAKRAALVTSNTQAAKEQYPKGLSEAVMLSMCMDIARGMHYLSKCKLVHRDLAARNCMVDDKMSVKVADFGLSRDIHLSDYYRLTHKQKLPVKWMAPESLFKKLYNLKTDVWSYGIVCWEVFKLGKKPYAGIDNPDLPNYISHGFRPKKPSRCPDELFKLMQDMWREDPEKRPDFREIILFLADLMHYSGDIESDLIAETKNCEKVEKEHNYHELELTASPQNDEGPYAILEEPVYHNFSRDESLDSPEEYEVPQQALSSESPHAGYEVPVVSSQDTESAKSVDSDTGAVPMEYEIPQSKVTKKAIPNGRSSSSNRPNHLPHKSPTHREFSAAAEMTKKVNSPRQDRSSQSSPARRIHKLPATGPINIRNAKGAMADDKTQTERAVSPGYLRLSYPAIQKAASVPSSSANVVSTPDKPYSTLEWKKSAAVTDRHSLPHQFTHKNHIYQTLEYEPKHSQ